MRRQDYFLAQDNKIQLQIHLVQIKIDKCLLPVLSTYCSFCMLEYFYGIASLQDHVSCQLLIFLYIYNKWWINYIKCSLKGHAQRSQWHLLLMTKGEEARISITLTAITPQKQFKCLCIAASVIAQGREKDESK